MVDDVTRKLVTAITKLQHDVKRLLSSRPLENSSVRNGMLRFIGGVLRLDSGALLELVGQWRFFGNGAITGDVYSEGKWTQVGDYDFTGNGDLAGDVTMSGNFDLTGKFTSLNVRIEGGKIYVGAGASLIVIDGATGKILAGNMAIDPADGGSVSFPGGAVVRGAPGGGAEVRQGSYAAVVTSSGASLGKVGLAVAVTDANGISFAGVPSGSPGPQYPAGVYYANGLGQLRKASGS